MYASTLIAAPFGADTTAETIDFLRRLGFEEEQLTVDDSVEWSAAEAPAACVVRLADAVNRSIDAGNVPFVVGGSRSILPGCLLAARRMDRYGLFAVDPSASLEVDEDMAASALGVCLGRGGDDLSNIEGRRPYLVPQDMVVFGCRDADEEAWRLDAHLFDIPEIRLMGLIAQIHRGTAFMRTNERDFWLHIDRNVVKDDRDEGLLFEEVKTLIGLVFASDMVIGMSVSG